MGAFVLLLGVNRNAIVVRPNPHVLSSENRDKTCFSYAEWRKTAKSY
jgi:hypothetical protein